MKRYIFLLIAGFIFTFIYVSFFQVIFGYFTPNFLLILPISFAYIGKKDSAYFLAFILGLFADLLSGNYLGLTSIFLISIVAIYIQLKLRVGYLRVITFLAIFFGNILFELLMQQIVYENSLKLGQTMIQTLVSCVFVFVTVILLKLVPQDYMKENINEAK